MTRKARIEQRLRDALTPVVLDVHDESSMHSVPRDAETHFRVTVVAAAFEGKPLVTRHRLVYAALDEELAAGLHALTITSRSPTEWEASQSTVASPPCRGGSK